MGSRERRWTGRAAIHTLGCRLNQAESALIAGDLERHGFRIVAAGEPCELAVVNSCTVTAAASRKTRQTARALRRSQPDAYLVLVGCDANVAADSWLADGSVDLIVPNSAKTRLCEFLPARLARQTTQLAGNESTSADPFVESGPGVSPERTRANLKIQEGCGFFCSYCIVPYARGPARSRDWADLLREARELVAQGYREIVLTGVNIATYSHGGRDLADVLRALLDLPGEFRVRLSSTEPGPILPRVIDVMREDPRVCRFLHLPLQYGEDRILERMNRRYRLAEYEQVARLAANSLPGLCLGTDIIVGFPGETEETFALCRESIARLPVNHLHVFTYSPREGTPAAGFPDQVPGDLATRRADELTRLGAAKAEAFARSQIGRILWIVSEERNARGNWEGWSDNYLRVEVEVGEGEGNALIPVRITDTNEGRQVAGIRSEEERWPAR